MVFEQTVKGWMIKMSQDIIDMKQGLKLLLDKTPSGDGTDGAAGKCSECAHCHPELLNDTKSMDFAKVKNEEDLNIVETQLDTDNEFKNKLMNLCFNAIGFTRQADEIQTCCLELSRVLFDKVFWATVTWTGSKEKFALSTHVTILDFFKFIIRKTTNSKPPDSHFASFFQGRAKNWAQQLKVQANRKIKNRARGPKDPGSAKKKKENSPDDDLENEDPELASQGTNETTNDGEQ